MYIIKTVSKSKKNSNDKYYTYRIMESVRVGTKVKKITLLNLGSSFSVEQTEWAELSRRVDDIIHQRARLFALDIKLESLAQEYAAKIIASKAKAAAKESSSDENRYKEIETATIKNSHPKTIGVEHILYETIKELGIIEKFKTLGFTNRQLHSAIGTIVAKCANPGSEARSHQWLQSHSAIDELIGCDFTKISSNTLYRVSDTLYKHKEEIEQHLYDTQKYNTPNNQDNSLKNLSGVAS